MPFESLGALDLFSGFVPPGLEIAIRDISNGRSTYHKILKRTDPGVEKAIENARTRQNPAN